jgi:hypothetical protein
MTDKRRRITIRKRERPKGGSPMGRSMPSEEMTAGERYEIRIAHTDGEINAVRLEYFDDETPG